MTRTAQKGRTGEAYAAALYEKAGFRILEKNLHCRFGEIDLIAADGETIVFCEVKLREEGSLVSPLEAVTPQKQEKLRLTAQLYLQKHPTSLQPRFDVVAVTALGGRITRHEWIQNAF